jgi:translation elongation factor EF-G
MLKKLVILFAFAFWAFTLSLMLSNDANAQKGKDPTVKDITTYTPVLFYIYEKVNDAGEELGTVEIQVYDRLHQFVSFEMDKLVMQAKGNDVPNPLVKLIQMPEIGALAFRQAESLEELDRPVDGLTTLVVREKKLRATSRVVYLPFK